MFEKEEFASQLQDVKGYNACIQPLVNNSLNVDVDAVCFMLHYVWICSNLATFNIIVKPLGKETCMKVCNISKFGSTSYKIPRGIVLGGSSSS